MRVVHAIKATGIAGAEAHLLNLLPGLKAQGVDVHALVLQEPARPVPDYLARWQALNINAEIIPIRHDLDLRVIGRMAHAVRRLQPDILHTHLFHADLYGPLAARNAGLRTVISSRHNDDAFRHKLPVRTQVRLFDGLINHYIAISESVRRFTAEVERISPAKISTVHYGLPAAQSPTPDNLRQTLALPANGPLAAVVARLVAQKGIDYLLAAFAQVVAVVPDAHLLVVGDGPLRAELEAQTDSLKLSANVHFTGWRDDVPHIMTAIDLLVMPSLWEGFGLVALEAMSHARPIVATRVSALPEIIVHGETGWLAPPADPDALAKALLEALRQPDVASAYGQRGLERLKNHFSVDKMVAETLRIYHTQLERT